MSMYPSRAELEADIEEKTEDLRVFRHSLDQIHTRLLDSQENSKSPMPLHQWSGAMGIRDLLEVVVNNMERMKTELEALREQYPEEEQKPRLRLVE